MKTKLLLLLFSIYGTVNAQLTVSTYSTSPTDCNAACIGRSFAQVSGGTGPYSYMWLPSGGTSAVATGLCAGSYTVYASDALGSTVSATAVITPTLIATGSMSCTASPSTILSGSFSQLNSALPAGVTSYSYVWSPDSTLTWPNSTSPVASPIATTCYTVHIVDLNGCPNSCAVCVNVTLTDIEENEDLAVFNISPNPFSYSTTLYMDNVFEDATIKMYNLFGQQVKEIKNISGQEFVLYREDLASGVYFIRLLQDNKILETDKIVVADN